MSPDSLLLPFGVEVLLIPWYDIALRAWNGLLSASNPVECENRLLIIHGSAPFFHLIVSIIGLLDMSYVHRVREKSPKLSSDNFNEEASSPVFIMTCVVARLIFFLKPMYSERL